MDRELANHSARNIHSASVETECEAEWIKQKMKILLYAERSQGGCGAERRESEETVRRDGSGRLVRKGLLPCILV